MRERDAIRARLYWTSIVVLIVLAVGVCIPLGFATQQYITFAVVQFLLVALWIVLFGKYRPRRGGN